MRKGNSEHKIKIAKTFIFCLLFCALLCVFMINEVKENKKNFVDFFGKQQESLVREQAKNAQVILNLTDSQTEELEKKSLEEVMKKAKNSENYILAAGKVNAHNMYLYIFTGVVCCIFLITTIYCTLIIDKKNQKIDLKHSIIKEKSIIIDRLNEKASSDNKKSKDTDIKDELTGVYNRKFFDASLRKINDRNLLPVGIITFEMNKNEGFKTDYILKRTAQLLEDVSVKSKIVSRISKYEFSIILLNTDKDASCDVLEEIKTKFSGMFEELKLIVIIDSYKKSEESENSYKVFKKNYRK